MQETRWTDGGGCQTGCTVDDVWRSYVEVRNTETSHMAKYKTAFSIEADRKLADLQRHITQYRNHLVEHYLPLVKYNAERLRNKLPDEVDLEDLVMEGVLGLMKAIDQYDVDRGVRFETFAPKRIRGAMQDYLRSVDWAPRLVRTRSKKVKQAILDHQMKFGRTPTQEELATILGVSGREAARILGDAAVVGVTSVDRTVKWNDMLGESPVINAIADPNSQDPLVAVQLNDLRATITRGLSPTERLSLILYYFEEMTMKEIAITLGLSESRISQIHSSIMERLKAKYQGQERELLSISQ